MKKFWVCILIFISMVSFGHAAPPQRIEVTNAIARKAVCNDGNPAVYWFSPGFGSGLKRWVIVLNGGGKGCFTRCCSTELILQMHYTNRTGKESSIVI